MSFREENNLLQDFGVENPAFSYTVSYEDECLLGGSTHVCDWLEGLGVSI